MTTRIVDWKAPGEEIYVTFDFSPYLDGELIMGTPTVTCERDAGAALNNPAAMISGPALVTDGAIVSQKIVGGTALDDYRLTCLVDTPTRKLALAAILPVRVA